MLAFLVIIFLATIGLSFTFYNVEYFKSDPLSDSITNLQKKFLELEAVAKKAQKTQVSTPDGFIPVASLISNEYNNLSTLKNIYNSANLKNTSSIIKSLNSSYAKYNYINTYLKLNLPPLVNNLNVSKPPKTRKGSFKKHKGINLKKQTKLTGKSLSRKYKVSKPHSSIINHATKNSIIKELVKRFGLKDSRGSRGRKLSRGSRGRKLSRGSRGRKLSRGSKGRKLSRGSKGRKLSRGSKGRKLSRGSKGRKLSRGSKGGKKFRRN